MKDQYILLHGDRRINHKTNKPFDIKSGDRLKLRINFKRKCIQLFYNDEFVRQIFEGLSVDHTKLVPYVSLFAADIEMVKSCCI